MIVSVGYMGSISDSEWAVMAPHLGMRCWVGGAGDLAPSVTSASARQVRVAAGSAGASGVMDVLDAAESVTLAALASGSRVDVVCLRRSWTPAGTPTGTTSVVVVSGTSLSAALAALRRTPGTVVGEDQPLAAFQVAASGGSASVSLLEDLRVWAANGGIVAASSGALIVLDDPGTTVRIGEDVWTRVVGQGGASWVRSSTPQFVPSAVALFGTPPDGAQLVIQSGTLVVRSDRSGFARITFRKPFPGGLSTVQLTNGDSAAAPGARMEVSGDTAAFGSEAHGNRVSVVYILRSASGQVLPNLQHRVDWLAIGW